MELNLTPLNLTGNPEDEKRPVIIPAPASPETEEQVMTTATQLARKGVKLFRAAFGNREPNRAVSKALAKRALHGCSVCSRNWA